MWYAPNLRRNLLSYGKLAKAGRELNSANNKHAITNNGTVVFQLRLEGDVVVVDNAYGLHERKFAGMVFAAAGESFAEDNDTTQKGTLVEFHHRFGHLAYDTIEHMASDPQSGITLTSNQRKNCLTCAEGKQTRLNQQELTVLETLPLIVSGR